MCYDFRERLQNAWENGRFLHTNVYYSRLSRIANSNLASGPDGEGIHPSIIENWEELGGVDIDEERLAAGRRARNGGGRTRMSGQLGLGRYTAPNGMSFDVNVTFSI